MKFELTVVTVVYNNEDKIGKCMDSVIKQLTSNIEYLIIDGKSKDKTIDIVEQKSKKSKNIKYISEEDNGIYDAMNKAIELANGKWIYFLNSDDLLKENILNKVISVISNKKYDCIYGDIEEVLELNNKKYYKIIKAKESLNDLKKGMVFSHQSFFCKTEIIKEIGMFDTSFKIAGDWDLISRIYRNNYKFYNINEVIAEFYLGGACSNPHDIERHKVRKTNNFYKSIDIYFIKDMLNTLKTTILKIILGEYNKGCNNHKFTNLKIKVYDYRLKS